MKLNKKTILFCFILLTVSVAIKIICAPNINLSGFSSLLAIALFSGLRIKNREFSFLLPILILFLSDLCIQLLHSAGLFPFAGFYKDQYINYFLITIVTGIGFLLRNMKTPGFVLSIVAGPAFYFLASNYSVWVANQGLGYTKDLNGLIQCYELALPFYKNSLLATVIFLPAFVGLYEWVVNGKFSLHFKKV